MLSASDDEIINSKWHKCMGSTPVTCKDWLVRLNTLINEYAFKESCESKVDVNLKQLFQ